MLLLEYLPGRYPAVPFRVPEDELPRADRLPLEDRGGLVQVQPAQAEAGLDERGGIPVGEGTGDDVLSDIHYEDASSSRRPRSRHAARITRRRSGPILITRRPSGNSSVSSSCSWHG